MTKKEAQTLAAALGWKVSGADELADRCDVEGYFLGVEHATGDWVVMSNRIVIARAT